MNSLSNLGEFTNSKVNMAIETSRQPTQIPKVRNLEEARKAAQEFEAVFISQMLKPMFENIEAEAPFGGGAGEDVWKGLQIEEYGKSIAKAGGIGLANQILSEILKMQEVH